MRLPERGRRELYMNHSLRLETCMEYQIPISLKTFGFEKLKLSQLVSYAAKQVKAVPFHQNESDAVRSVFKVLTTASGSWRLFVSPLIETSLPESLHHCILLVFILFLCFHPHRPTRVGLFLLWFDRVVTRVAE